MERNAKESGFSLVELLISMSITLILLCLVSVLLAQSLTTRTRESRKAEALNSAQAAMNLMSREIANAGFALTSNGIVTADSNIQKLHYRTNLNNADAITNGPGEDVTFYFDPTSQSVVRFDRYGTPQTSVLLDRISNVTFEYFDYIGSSSTPVVRSSPTADTARVRISVSVRLEPVPGKPDETVDFTSDAALRNSKYVLRNY